MNSPYEPRDDGERTIHRVIDAAAERAFSVYGEDISAEGIAQICYRWKQALSIGGQDRLFLSAKTDYKTAKEKGGVTPNDAFIIDMAIAVAEHLGRSSDLEGGEQGLTQLPSR